MQVFTSTPEVQRFLWKLHRGGEHWVFLALDFNGVQFCSHLWENSGDDGLWVKGVLAVGFLPSELGRAIVVGVPKSAAPLESFQRELAQTPHVQALSSLYILCDKKPLATGAAEKVVQWLKPPVGGDGASAGFWSGELRED